MCCEKTPFVILCACQIRGLASRIMRRGIHNFTALERLHEIWVAGYAHNYILAGGLEHYFYAFPYIGNNNPN